MTDIELSNHRKTVEENNYRFYQASFSMVKKEGVGRVRVFVLARINVPISLLIEMIQLEEESEKSEYAYEDNTIKIINYYMNNSFNNKRSIKTYFLNPREKEAWDEKKLNRLNNIFD